PPSGSRRIGPTSRVMSAPRKAITPAASHGWHMTPARALSVVDFSADELLDEIARQIVGDLGRRMLHEIRRDAAERSCDAAITRQPTAANGVDRDAGRVGTVLDGQTKLELHRDVPERATFEPK